MTYKSQYHYHFYPQADSSGYDGCLVSQCSPDVASDIVGVAYDGFPIYGPTQVWLKTTVSQKSHIDLIGQLIKPDESGFQHPKIEFITIPGIAQIVN